MKRRRVVLVVLGSVVALILVAVLWPREREPEYQGRKLSEWLDQCSPSTRKPSPQCMDAIRHMGTNAFPFLVRWVAYDPVWKMWVVGCTSKLPSELRPTSLGRSLVVNRTLYRADAAAKVFEMLGRDALPAVEGLSRIEANHSKPNASRRAWICLAVIGKRLDDKPEREPTRSIPWRADTNVPWVWIKD